MDNELGKYIRHLRDEEGVPLYFRRSWRGNYHRAPVWYIWYIDTLIATAVNEQTASVAVDTAVVVHSTAYMLHSDQDAQRELNAA